MSSSGQDWSNAYSDELFGEGREEEEDELATEAEEKNKDAVIFLVDCNSSMWQKNPKDDQPYLSLVFTALRDALKNKIVSNSNDLVGITLFGTKKKRDEDQFDNVFVVNKLDIPNAKLIKDVEALADPKVFEKDIGSVGDKQYEFFKALWQCQLLFNDSAIKKATKRLIVFTNTDDPSFDNKDAKNKIMQQLKDYDDLDLSVHLIAFDRPDHKFTPFKFWVDAVKMEVDEAHKLTEKSAADMDDLRERLRKKEFKKRTLGSLPFELGNGIKLHLKMYCMYRAAQKDYGKWLDAKTNDLLTTNTSWVCPDTGKILEEHEIKTYMPYGGEKVEMSKDEMKQIKGLAEPGLLLMGFKPKERLKDFHNIKPPYFLYPDESTMKGSTMAFAALIKEMDKKGKIAVCRLIARKGTIPRFVALLPQVEQNDKDGCQIKPPGMHMIFLPYADDIRNLKFEPTAVAENDLIDKAKQVIKSLPVKFDNQTFENPSLQKHYAVIQALALDEKSPEEVEDTTLPAYDAMAKRADKIRDFAEAAGMGPVPDDDVDMDGDDDDGDKKKSYAGSKRKEPSSSSSSKGSKAKKAKVEDDSGVDWKDAVAKGTIKKLTIPQLKVYCRAHGLPLGGKKDDLLKRVTDHVGGK